MACRSTGKLPEVAPKGGGVDIASTATQSKSQYLHSNVIKNVVGFLRGGGGRSNGDGPDWPAIRDAYPAFVTHTPPAYRTIGWLRLEILSR